MTKYNEDYELPVYSEQELKSFYTSGQLNSIIFNEIKMELQVSELNQISEEILELTNKNVEFGGSPHGYYFDNELYPIGSSYNIGEIGSIDDSLYDQAMNIKANREEIQQDLSYIGNMVATLTSMSNDLFVWLSNLPAETSKFSPSLLKLEALADMADSDWRSKYKYSRDNPEFAVFYMHYDRVEPKLKRYVFRQVTR